MKIKIALSVLLSFVWYLLSSQVPQGFTYQAIARNNSNNPIANTSLPVTLTIQSDSLGGIIFWKELHPSVQTNSFGVFTLTIGKGIRQAESTVATFNNIDWTITPKFLKTEIYYENELKNMGSSRLWAVPYSMVAGGLGGSLDKLKVLGAATSLDEALFEVRNKDGQIVFAVYNEGVRIYVDDGAKGAKGGFAIGGFDKTKEGINQDFFVVNRDSVRIYLDTNSVKVKKGGFAIGGFDPSKKGAGEKYLQITRDSARIYLNTDPVKAKKGGFAIGGFSGTKTEINNFLNLSPENYFIGHKSGASNTTGLYNSFMGYEAGTLNTEGAWNTFIGYKAGYANTTGYANIFIGDSAGTSNTTGQTNVMIGNWAGYLNTTGNRNVIIGTAGYENTSGTRNVLVGTFAGTYNHEGTGNVYVGDYAGAKLPAGNNNVFLVRQAGGGAINGALQGTEGNVFIGMRAGFSADSTNESVYIGAGTGYNSTGIQNVFVGAQAGYNNEVGRSNVFLGFQAGMNETESGKLYISNTDTDSPLIWGDFVTGSVVLSGNQTTNLNNRLLFVCGTAGGQTPWYNDSDRKQKHDIITIPNALQKVLQLRGVNFLWNDPKEGMEGLQMGFIGQEAAEVIPEIVSVKNNHYSMQYAPVTALLVEGIKEQEQKIVSMQKEIDELKALINKLMILKAEQK